MGVPGGELGDVRGRRRSVPEQGGSFEAGDRTPRSTTRRREEDQSGRLRRPRPNADLAPAGISVRSWTTSSMSGRSPGGSPVAVRCVDLAQQRPDDIHSCGRTRRGPGRSPWNRRSPPVEESGRRPFRRGRVTGAGRPRRDGAAEEGRARSWRRSLPGSTRPGSKLPSPDRRMQADDGQALGGGAAEGLAAELDRPPHDHRVDPRSGQGVVEIRGAGIPAIAGSAKPGKAPSNRCSGRSRSQCAQASSSSPFPRIRIFIVSVGSRQ